MRRDHELKRFVARQDVEVDGRRIKRGHAFLGWPDRVEHLLDADLIVPQPRRTDEEMRERPARNPLEALL